MTRLPTLISNRYQRIGTIGKGRSGEVIKALDTKERRRLVAIKLFKHTGDLYRVHCFESEIRALAKLNDPDNPDRCPHIAMLYDVGQDDGIYYLVMEYLEGETLLNYRLGQQEQRVEPSQAISLILQIASALDYAHRAGIIHRDIKPSNIMVVQDQNRVPFVKVLDFGFASLTDLYIATRSEPEVVMGTVAYMAPEQLDMPEVPISPVTDLYSLGVVFYELVTSRRPFEDATDQQTLRHHLLAVRPKPPSSANPQIDEVLDKIILTMLKTQPTERYRSAKDLNADLRKYQHALMSGQDLRRFQVTIAASPKQVLPFRTKLIGRERETEQLKKAFDDAADGKGQLFLIAGEPGVGKSRLVDELRTYVRECGGLFIAGKCHELTRAFPYAPLAESIEDYVRRIENDVRADHTTLIKRVITDKIGNLGTVLTRIFPATKKLVGETGELVTSKWERDREVERFLSVASDFLVSIASKEIPVLLFLDDLQWVDGGSLELLERVFRQLGSANLLIIGSYRNDEVKKGHPLYSFIDRCSLSRGDLIKRLELERLNSEDVIVLLVELLNMPESQARDIASVIFEKIPKNPFFTLEMVKALIQNRVLSFEDDIWKFDRELATRTVVSQKVDEVIVKRLDDVQKESLEVLRYAAVIGRNFNSDDLVHMSGKTKEEVYRALDEATRHYIIESKKTSTALQSHRFIHDKILETLCSQIGDREGRHLHQKLGEYLEKRYENRLNDVLFELASHFAKGLDKQKALSYCWKAGDLAKMTFANADAASFYKTVLDLLDDGITLNGIDSDRLKVEIKENLGDARALLARYDEARALYKDVRASLTEQLDISRVETKLGTISFKQGDTEQTLEHFHNGLAALDIRQPKTTGGIIASIIFEFMKQAGHTYFPYLFVKHRPAVPNRKDLESVRLFELLIYYYYFIDMLRCFQIHLKQINLAERTHSLASRQIAYSLHELLCNAIGMHRRALRYAEKALALEQMVGGAQRPSDGSLAGIGNSGILAKGRAHYYRAEWEQAVEWLTKASEETKKVGNFWETEVAYGHLCIAYFGLGRFDKIDKYAAELKDIADKVDDIRGKGWGQILFALRDSHQGKLVDAILHAQSAIADCKKAKDNLVTAMSLRILGLAFLKKGIIERDLNKKVISALQCFDEALSALRESHDIIWNHWLFHDFIAGTYVVLAEAYVERGQTDQSRRKEYLGKARWPLMAALILGGIFKNWRAYAYRVTGKYMWAKGHTKIGTKFFQKSIVVASRLKAKYDEAQAHLELGRRLLEKEAPMQGESP